MTIAYGMTETSPVSFQSSTDDPLERRVSTVGRIQPHLEVKIVDERGRIVPRGVAGELLHPRLLGDARLLGRRADRRGDRRRALDAHRRPRHDRRRGLLQHRRPDQGHGDPRRREHLPARGRGVPLHPPDRSDVQCFGVPWVQLREGASLTEQELAEFCKGSIAHYKIPKYIRFVDEFPMTVTGKIQKFAMRQK